ncbi:hypothetical protein TNCV_4165771 [Trichonephila clavipes]|nr:hypothetical protein TNCV_4165771 [Trichonephila clavipes]
MAVVFPILKPNSDDYNPQNYRPISLLSSLSIAYEFVILNRLNQHCLSRNIIIPEQHSFVTKCSTVTQLLKVTELVPQASKTIRLRDKLEKSTDFCHLPPGWCLIKYVPYLPIELFLALTGSMSSATAVGHGIHLQTSMSAPGFEPRPNGTAVSVTNHYTGWATIDRFLSTWEHQRRLEHTAKWQQK